MLNNKQFLLWLLPVAVFAFMAGPLVVLHSFDLPTPAVTRTLQPIELSSRDVTAKLPNTVPLMFEMAKYPAIGHQSLEVHDFRLMNLTSFAGMVGQPADEKITAALLGYMSTTEVLRQKKRSPGSYPVGDLLFVTKVYFTGFDDETGERESLVLETQRARRFQLKSVQYDESSELLFGQVEWIGEQAA